MYLCLTMTGEAEPKHGAEPSEIKARIPAETGEFNQLPTPLYHDTVYSVRKRMGMDKRASRHSDMAVIFGERRRNRR